MKILFISQQPQRKLWTSFLKVLVVCVKRLELLYSSISFVQNSFETFIASLNAVVVVDSIKIWHERLCHVNYKYLDKWLTMKRRWPKYEESEH